MRTVLGWTAKLPDDVVNARLRLRPSKAWALALSLRTGEATRVVEELAKDVARSRRAGSRASDDGNPTLVAEVNAVRALISTLSDDIPRALELGRAAASTGSAPPWVRRFAETAQVAGLMYDGKFDEVRRMASPPLVEGRLADAVRILESALARAENAVGRDSAAAALPSGYLAALYYERNDLDRTRQMVSGRKAIAMEACPLGSLLRYCRAAACLYARSGDLGSALVILEEARQVATSRHWLRLRAGCDAEAVRLHLREHRLDRAEQTAQALAALMPEQFPSPMGSFLETWASYCTVKARIQIATDRSGAAAALLDDLRGKLVGIGMQYLEARTCILLALALEQTGARDAALASLERALRYAGENDMINSFVDEGEPLRLLLRHWRRGDAGRAGIDIGFLDQLGAAFDEDAAAASTVHAAATRIHSELLSSREIEVLQKVSGGLSNKEIGRALHVAPETIKWHLKNIYEKLSVGTRIEAVQSGLGSAPPHERPPGASLAQRQPGFAGGPPRP